MFIGYKDLDPFGHVERWGFYTRYGEIGVIFGAFLPLCLWRVAGYLALKLHLKNVDR